MPEPVAVFQEHLISPTTASGAIWRFNREYWRPTHYHAQLELILVTRGRLRERIGRACHTAHAGQLLWHLPGIEHRAVEASADCDFVVVQAEPYLCAKVGAQLRRARRAEADASEPFAAWIRELGWLSAGRPVVELKRTDRDRVLEACAVTFERDQLEPEDARRRVQAALDAAWRATIDDHDDRRPSSLVELACCYLLEQPSLAQPALCRELDVSESYLSRCFRAELGPAFVEQRARVRLSTFCTEVSRGQNFLEAALSAGFGSYSQLHRVFVRLVGVNPRDYFLHGGRNRRSELRLARKP